MVRTPFRSLLLLILAILLLPSVAAAETPVLSQYLPAGVRYDPAVPTPAEVLGFELGTWHVRHDQLVAYMRALAAASPRVEFAVTGHSYEHRELVLLTISDPDNLAHIEAIREAHLAALDPTRTAPASPDGARAQQPVVVALGYSVHGDEASGANASLAVAYHLAAAQDETTRRWLREAVILLDPAFNPDGLGRFAGWVNMHRGAVLVADPASREHLQGWPRGRTNHYWFDLNRDYITGQHPETRARLATFHRWRPNVYTDHHEMGTDSTFFFQPGVPSRKHPLTPIENVTLTQKIARYHARALDRQGRLYYSEESFDDFYYGKGSTYPDIHGAIGILFEQASARGHLQDSDNGPLSFPFAIANHATASFTTLAAAVDLRSELLDYQARFFRDALAEAKRGAVRGWVFGSAGDGVRAAALIRALGQHRIVVRALARALDVGGTRFEPGAAWVVEAAQPQARLIRALFETRTQFDDATFYDVSAWTLPLAFGLPFATLDAKTAGAEGKPISAAELTARLTQTAVETSAAETRAAEQHGEQPVAWAFDWDGYYAPRALYRLEAAGAITRVATEPFTAQTARGPRRFDRGTIVVPRGLQRDLDPQSLASLLESVAAQDSVAVYALASGLTEQGIDLGSPSLRPLDTPRVALLVGSGVSMYQAGEVWHLLDFRFHLPLTLLERDNIRPGGLDPYTHVILVEGGWDHLPETATHTLHAFARDGGIVVTLGSAARWAADQLFAHQRADQDAAPPAKRTKVQDPDQEPPARRPYAQYRADRAVDLVAGAIFQIELDTTHPLAFGYRQPLLPSFRTSARVLDRRPGAYATLAQYTAKPLLAGYASDQNQAKIAGTPAIDAHLLGRGLVVRMIDDPNFRAFWYGTNKLFLNTIFFGSVVQPTP